jgi:hypothetical protein
MEKVILRGACACLVRSFVRPSVRLVRMYVRTSLVRSALVKSMDDDVQTVFLALMSVWYDDGCCSQFPSGVC